MNEYYSSGQPELSARSAEMKDIDRATEVGIIRLSNDNRAFSWASNDRKLMTVPFDENPYSALAAWFKTDEGMDVFSSIEKRLK